MGGIRRIKKEDIGKNNLNRRSGSAIPITEDKHTNGYERLKESHLREPSSNAM